MNMITPIISLLAIVVSAHAADAVPGQNEAIATTKNIQLTLKNVDAGAPSCSGSYAQSKCPNIQPKGLRDSYLKPERDFYANLLTNLNNLTLNLKAAIEKNAAAPVINSTNAGKGADEAVIADITPRLASVAESRKAAEAMEKEVKDRIAELHRKDPKVASEAVACGAQNMVSQSKLMEFCGRLDSKKDAISCVLKAGPLDFTCSNNTRSQYGTYSDVQIKQLAADLGVLSSYLKQKEASLTADKTAAEARVAKFNLQDSKPAAVAAAPAIAHAPAAASARTPASTPALPAWMQQ